MIHNDEQFRIVREQLMHVENALLDLRKTVLPKNQRNYEILAEADIDMIWTLRAELDEYLGLKQQPHREATNGEADPGAAEQEHEEAVRH